MFFRGRYELAPFGEEFNTSFVVVKLLDKNQILKFNREVAKISKTLGTDEDVEKSLDSSEKVLDLMYKGIAEAFVSGEIFDEEIGEVRPMKKSDIESFPPTIVKELNQFIQGSLEKKI